MPAEIVSKKRSFNVSRQKTPLSRVWFLSRGCKQVPLESTGGKVLWAHPDGYFLNAQGQKVAHCYSPSRLRITKDTSRKTGKLYPVERSTGSKACHLLMALTFYGPRPTYTDKNGNEYVGICHHLIPDPLNYRPANLLCWLTREQHTEADRRQRALRKVVPDGDLSLFTYERLRDLQDPRSMSREQFEIELAAIRNAHFTRVDPLARMEYDMTHHCEV